FKSVKFSEHITELSPSFVEIYNQASEAEHHGLDQVAGPGYRKCLEFLIKDYVIKRTEKDSVKREQLMSVIMNHIHHDRIKEIAKRAAWLGNDETHYERRWEDRDIQDLKKLINLVVHYIEMELEADQYEEAMPSGKK
ncbi:MAG: hypothetical protein K6T83_22115, partial [Alicyclobacillus sp.]|nr:hypothetical protein [Alicyclobacillus sp.]